MPAIEPYEPLNVLKPFADNVWIADGPVIHMDYGPFSLPFPTRMVVVRLGSGDLWVHSPIASDEGLWKAVDALGPVRHLVAPNSIHYWFMADWLARYPVATSYAVADLRTKAKRSFRIDGVLVDGANFEWEDEIEWVLVPGTAVSEAVFHVRSASVAILTDLIENFEPERIGSRALRWLIRLGKANGHTPTDLRWTFWPKRREVSRQVGRILAWKPEKVVLAHGAPYPSGGARELDRALGWAVRR